MYERDTRQQKMYGKRLQYTMLLHTLPTYTEIYVKVQKSILQVGKSPVDGRKEDVGEGQKSEGTNYIDYVADY